MRRVSEREPAIRQFVIVKNKLMSVFNGVCPVIDHESRHNIVKVVCGSTRLIHSYFDHVMTKFMINLTNLMSVFYASVLLLIMNFVITLSK